MVTRILLISYSILAICVYPNSSLAKEKPSDSSACSQHMVGPYPDGASVTRDCLKCHQKEGEAILSSAHWLWKGPTPFLEGHENDKNLGKKNLMNNF